MTTEEIVVILKERKEERKKGRKEERKERKERKGLVFYKKATQTS